jgi:hypothetical protein
MIETIAKISKKESKRREKMMNGVNFMLKRSLVDVITVIIIFL